MKTTKKAPRKTVDRSKLHLEVGGKLVPLPEHVGNRRIPTQRPGRKVRSRKPGR